MPYVSGKLGEVISQYMDEANKLYFTGDLSGALSTFEKAWDALPNEKYQYDESYLIVWSILSIAFKTDDIALMNRWIKHIFLADPERVDCGEREMWADRVALASGKKDEAFRYAIIAGQKSHGRCFEVQDKELKEAYMKIK